MGTWLNQRALHAVDRLRADADALGVALHEVGGATIIDCGVKAGGGVRAGLDVARVCLADLAEVTLVPGDASSVDLPRVQVACDQPLRACMASQYAGWQISVGKYFAMGSGPMRAIYGKEKLFDDIGHREKSPHAVGVLETGKLPTEEVIQFICGKLGLAPQHLTLLAAATRSLAGGVQVVARALEMSLHKLHELKFDLKQIRSGVASAPLPPPAADDMAAIGRTNDAILYGGRATLFVDADDALLAELGPKVPASASPEFGALFAELFAKYNGDFYQIDPMLFSPAEVVFCNLRTGRVHSFGRMDVEVLRRSFGM
jgi:methenyltetrahydromethanopterin cyclohydrolase